MISFKEFIQLQEVTLRTRSKLAIAGAVGLATGAGMGWEVGSRHQDAINAKNDVISQTISKGKKMVNAQRWAREKNSDKVIKAALAKPTERLSSEMPDLGDFAKSLERDHFKDSAAAKIHHHDPKNDKSMSTARTPIITPDSQWAIETPKIKYPGGSKYSMNYKKTPEPGANPYANYQISGANEEPPSLIGKPQLRKKK